MSSIRHEVTVNVGVEQAWSVLRDVAAAHILFAPVLSGCELTGDTRTVRFSNGMVVHERVLDVDDSRMRIAYAALDVPGMTHHHASMEMVGEGPRRCRFVWTTDFLPAEMHGTLAPLIEAGSNALKSNLERSLGGS